MWDYITGQHEWGLEVHSSQAADVVTIHVDESIVGFDSGIVHPDVDVTQSLDAPLDEAIDPISGGEVGREAVTPDVFSNDSQLVSRAGYDEDDRSL